MSRALTTNQLVNGVQRRAMLPETSSTLTAQDYIDILNEEIEINMVPNITSVHEDYFCTYSHVPVIPETTIIPMPYRAIGDRLKDLHFRDSQENFYECTRIDINAISDFRGTFGYSFSKSLIPFYVMDDTINLITNYRGQAGTFSFAYYMRPNTLVPDEQGSVITNIVTDDQAGTTTLYLSNFPNSFLNIQKMDIITHKSPHKILAYDKIPLEVNQISKMVKFTTSDLWSISQKVTPTEFEMRVQVNDYLCLAEESIVANMSDELQPLLMQYAAVYCLEALGDTNVDRARIKLDEMCKNLMTIIDNRVENAPKKVVQRYGPLSRIQFGRRIN